MKILIVGGDGMFGHQLLLGLQVKHDVRVTLRQSPNSYRQFALFNSNNSYFNVDVNHDAVLNEACADFRPDFLINAVGLVKQRVTAKEALPNLEINSLLPHRLANLCQQFNTRFIHISTDCVFSGKKGQYTEDDNSDAEDYYGRSKFLGEVDYPHCVTLRTSFIGLELSRKTSLLEWFLAQKGKIKGYCNAIYTGVTTTEMSRVIAYLLKNHPDLQGVWHVASQPISKYDLLMYLKKLLKKEDVHIDPDETFKCDRSLLGMAFEKKTGYRIPDWNTMLMELADQIAQREINVARQPCTV